MLKFILLSLSFITLILTGCDSTGISKVDIPTCLNGDWNIRGSLIANDESRRFDVNQNFEIVDGRVFSEGGEEWDGIFLNNQLIIKFQDVVFDGIVEGCGHVVVTANVTIIITILADNESEYFGIATGLFKIESECDGKSLIELSGDFILKRA